MQSTDDVYPILKYFKYDHLPPHLQQVSRPLFALAHDLAQVLPQGPETSAGLRKLLEAKDCFVRARLDAPVQVPHDPIPQRPADPLNPCTPEAP